MTPVRDALILVTGAAGLVGHAVARRLRDDGASVLPVDVAGDAVTAIDLARDRWPEDRFDAIVHCAARLPLRFEGPEADEAVAANRAMDAKAIEVAAKTGAHLVDFSTASVYGATTGAIDEVTPVAPALDYAQAKLETERAIDVRGIPATVFRLVAPYGPRQARPTVLLRFLDLALAGAPLQYYGTGGRTQDFLHVDDVAHAVALSLAKRARGVFVLASGEATTMRELATLVVQVTGSTSAVEAAGVPDPEEGQQIRYRIGRLRAATGFAPQRTLAGGIEEWARVRRASAASCAKID